MMTTESTDKKIFHVSSLLRLVVAGLLLSACYNAGAQLTTTSALRVMPSDIFPTLAQGEVLDAIDYAESGVKRQMPTLMGGKWQLDSLSDEFAHITIGEIESADLVVLTRGKYKLMMLIDRVDTPDTDAIVTFYNSRWETLPLDEYLVTPGFEEWTGKISSTDAQWLRDELPFITADATYDASTEELTFTPTIGSYVDVDKADRIKAMVKPRLVYRWDGNRFRLKK